MFKSIYNLHWSNTGVVGNLIYEVVGKTRTLNYKPLTDHKLSYPTGLYPTCIINKKLVTDKDFIPTHQDILNWLESRIYNDENFDIWEAAKKLNGKSADDKYWIINVNEKFIPEYKHPAIYVDGE